MTPATAAILSLLSQSYGLVICCLFVSVLFCFFPYSLKKEAAIGSVCGGAGAFMILKILSFQEIAVFSEIMQVLIPLGVSFLGYGLGYVYRQCMRKTLS